MATQFATFVLDTYGVVAESAAEEAAGSISAQNPNSQDQARQVASAPSNHGTRVLIRIIESSAAGARVMLALSKSPFTQIVGGVSYPPDSWSVELEDGVTEFFLEPSQAIYAIGTVASMVICVATSKWCPGGSS